MTSAERHHCWLQELPSSSQLESPYLEDTHQHLLDHGGTTRHSAEGRTLYLEVQRLEAAGVPYTLEARPGQGYIVTVPAPGDRE